jgi:hypothetical protein
VVAIRSVQASGVDWYELELAGGVKRYVEKERLPVWEEFDPNTDLVKQVQARGKPTKEAEQVRVLAPDSLIPSRRYGAHKSASVEKERWYWIAQADFPVFFSERDSVGALAQWTLVERCLQANKSLRARSAVMDGRDLDEFVHSDCPTNSTNRAFRRLVGSPPATWRQVKASSNGGRAVSFQR